LPSVNQTGHTDAEEDFFLPNFCGATPVFVLIMVSELFVVVMVLAASGIQEFAWDYLALVSLFVQWIVLSSAGILCGLRNSISRLSLPLSVAIIYGVVLGITGFITFIAQWVLAGALLEEIFRPPDWLGLLRNLISAAILTGLVLRYLFVQSQLRKQQRAELQARIAALQSRIRPHFLFNSMNSIVSLIRSDPELAEQVVEDLSDLFRASLKESPAPVPINQELDLCQCYVRIEQIRLGDRLLVDWKQDHISQTATIPLLTLQPLLENAIYHGIQPLAEGGKITVLIENPDQKVNITVSNPVPDDIKKGNKPGHNIALDNTLHRLLAHYGDSARLNTFVSDGLFVAKLSYECS